MHVLLVVLMVFHLLLDKACVSLSHPSAFLFQTLLKDGSVPNICRKADITSIFKRKKALSPQTTDQFL